jgi:peroxin-1
MSPHFVVVLYVDLSRYTEKPVQMLRMQFQFWLDKAMWHRPSVLVFDNLEKLLGTELEVLDPSYLASCVLTRNG